MADLDQTQEFIVPGLSMPNGGDGITVGVTADDSSAFNFTQPFNVSGMNRSSTDDGGGFAAAVDSTQAFDVVGDDDGSDGDGDAAAVGATQAFEPDVGGGTFLAPLPPTPASPDDPASTTQRFDVAGADDASASNDVGDDRRAVASPRADEDTNPESTQNIVTDLSESDELAGRESELVEEDYESEQKIAGASRRGRISSSDGEGVEEIRSIASMSPAASPPPEPSAAADDDGDNEPTTSRVGDDETPPPTTSTAGRRLRRLSTASSDDNNDDGNKDASPTRPVVVVDESPASPVGSDATAATDKKSEVGELIADIFGDSDDEQATAGNEANEAGIESDDQAVENQAAKSDDDNDTESEAKRYQEETEFVSDFDLMIQKKKNQNRNRRRRKRDYDFISNNDDIISDLLTQMKSAAKEDIDLNSLKLPATRKRALLPIVVKELKKADLLSTFIECGVVNVMAEWLSLLPDKSLASLEIRTEFLKILQMFPTLDHQILRSSGIGKSVMLLLKHPKETKENKERAQKLINEWARPIFNLQTDYRSLSKDERTKRDYDHMPVAKKRRLSSESEKQQIPRMGQQDNRVLGPGDKGFVGRARVPRPSTRDYVVRPKWNVESEFRKASSKKQTMSKMDKKIQEIKNKSAMKKHSHAVPVSISGGKMSV